MQLTRGYVCWKCNGLGWLVDAVRPGYTIYTSCTTCSGNGNVKHL